MAYKTFANGFPLPASDLNNFLMNQSVIVFADAAARGTAIPSPVEGMLTYLEDTNAYESWNGSAFVNINDNTDAIPKSTVTTAQDLIVADGASSVTRLGVGTDDQVLSVVAGAVAWADASGGGGNYYNITAPGTYTVDLAAGFYDVKSIGIVTVQGTEIDGVFGLKEFPSGIDTLVTEAIPFSMTSRTSDVGTTNLNAVAYGAGLYVVVGRDYALTTSPDGITWTSRASSTPIYSYDIAYGDGLFVAGGYYGDLSTSPDGITWTVRTSGFGDNVIWGVTYGDGLYVAVGQSGTLTTSPDGTTWTTRTSGFGSTQINGVTFGDGLYVAVGSSGKLTTSTDGTTWTTRTSGFGTTLINAVTYGDGLYVAVGQSGTLTTSPDGITWTVRTSGFGATHIHSVTYGEGLYVAVGNSGTLTTSPDGTTWTTRTSQFGSTFIEDVTHGNSLFIAVGDTGKISTSPSPNGLAKLFLDPKAPFINLPA
jgi:hypothetical protein